MHLWVVCERESKRVKKKDANLDYTEYRDGVYLRPANCQRRKARRGPRAPPLGLHGFPKLVLDAVYPPPLLPPPSQAPEIFHPLIIKSLSSSVIMLITLLGSIHPPREQQQRRGKACAGVVVRARHLLLPRCHRADPLVPSSAPLQSAPAPAGVGGLSCLEGLRFRPGGRGSWFLGGELEEQYGREHNARF